MEKKEIGENRMNENRKKNRKKLFKVGLELKFEHHRPNAFILLYSINLVCHNVNRNGF